MVLEGDPLLDIQALSAVRYTLRAGRVLYRSRESNGRYFRTLSM